MGKSKMPNKLRTYRKTTGYSQKEIAKVFGFKYINNISRWEKGLAIPSLEFLFCLSHLYGASPQELYPDLWQFSKEKLETRKHKALPQKTIRGITHFYL